MNEEVDKERIDEGETQEQAPLASVDQEEDFKDKYFRLLAEMENARKRLQKEKQDMTRFAKDALLIDILNPLDTFQKALGFAGQMSDETRNFAKGFEMILLQFQDILSQNGVCSFRSVGEFFDPHKHEAVEVQETTQHPEGMILEEFLGGYRSGNKTLRPARVKVAKAPTEKDSQDPQSHKQQ